MATAGWYDDPSGQPGAFRYWDGLRWSETVADTPYGPPPSGAAPPPPPPPLPPRDPQVSQSPQVPQAPMVPPPPVGFDTPTLVPGGEARGGFESYAAIGPLGPPPPTGYDDRPPPPVSAGSGSGSGRALALVLVAVLATLLLGVVSFVVVRGLIEDDSSATRTTTTGTPAPPETGDAPAPDAVPSEEPGTATDPEPDPGLEPGAEPGTPPSEGAVVEPTVQQCTGGLPSRGASTRDGRFITGGGLRVPTPDGFEAVLDQAPAFTFADEVHAPSKVVEQGATSSWVAVYALGSLNRGNGFDSPRQAAEVVVACMAQSTAFYSSISGSTLLDSGDAVVDGSPAWQLTQEIRVDDPGLTVEGDVVKVVVVDTGDPASYSLFVSVVPIGDTAMIAAQEASVGELELR